MVNMMPVLAVKNLCKAYPRSQKRLAVDSISFDLEAGEILGLLGPNGSGKTTTIQMLLGSLSVTSGVISYFGKNFKKNRSEILRLVSFASTYTSLPWLLTVEENLAVIGRLYELNARESAERYEPLLERFGILDKKKKRVSSLSAGQITRLMLVKAFFTHPRVVLLDEPTASLDADIAKETCEFILEQRDKNGLSILFTTHKMEEAAYLCDRVIFLKEGKTIVDDLPKNLIQSLSIFHLRLDSADEVERIATLAKEKRLLYKIEKGSIEIDMEEREIFSFLHSIDEAKIPYTGIQIKKPSLEDYFLQFARGSK